MKISELFKKLSEAFSEYEGFLDVIEVPEDEEIPLPYYYFVTGETVALEADNITFFSETPVTISWIEKNPSEEIEARMVEFLNENRLPFTEGTTYDSEIGAFVHDYFFTI